MPSPCHTRLSVCVVPVRKTGQKQVVEPPMRFAYLAQVFPPLKYVAFTVDFRLIETEDEPLAFSA